MIRPISTLPEAMVATDCRSSMPVMGVASSLTLPATREAALLMPALSAMGFTPEVTAFIPLLVMACVMMVEVVVPSPALLSDLDATSCTKRTPTFISGSSSEISRAIVTPSFTISGAP